MELWRPSYPRELLAQLDSLAPVPSHWPSLELLCQPVWGTPRRPERPTRGGAIALSAAGLGKRFMPWQSYVADVIGEYDPDTGVPFYREWRLLVPRQSGKTTFVLGKSVDRCIGWGRRQNTVYTAQTRSAAAEKWRLEYLPALNESPIYRDWFRSREAQGSERITWLNGSTWGLQSTQEDSGHGATLDEGAIDEAFSQKNGAIEQAMRPAMLTRRHAQLGILSTAGKADGSSPYLWGKVVDGRARVEAGQDRRIAYFEWTAATRDDPDGDDVDMLDPDGWPTFMPALGYTASPETVAADIEGMTDPNEVARAYGNLWRGAGKSDTAISSVLWTDCLDELSEIAGERLWWAVSVTPEQDHATIAVAGASSAGADVAHVELVDHLPGSDWCLDALLQRAGRWGERRVVIDADDPAVTLVPRLEAEGFEVKVLNTPSMASACMDFKDAVRDHLVAHLGDENINTAVATAVRRKLGNRWVLTGPPGSDIAPLKAVVLARYGHAKWPAYNPDDSFL